MTNHADINEFPRHAIGGLIIVGKRLDDGRILLQSDPVGPAKDDRIVEDFPNKLFALGSVYILDYIEETENGWLNARYI